MGRSWFVRWLECSSLSEMSGSLSNACRAIRTTSWNARSRRTSSWKQRNARPTGLSDKEARYAARRAFGNVTRTQEDVRAVWTRRWLDEIVQDVGYALRTLRKSPGFTTVAVLTLALGIGPNTAIFSVVNAVILQPLAYPKPEQLKFLTTRFERAGSGQSLVSPAEYWELAEINHSFSVVGAFVIGEVNLAARDRPRRVTGATVNAELLEALAVQPAQGRWFRREETRAGGPALVMLSYDLWQSGFGAPQDMVGRMIEVDGVMREVIGIMPAGFDLMDHHVELWLPLQLAPALRQYRGSHFLSVVGRVKDDVPPGKAEAELAALVATWGQRVGASGHVFTPGEHVMQMEPLQDEIVGSARRALWVLQAAVGLVLVIACANLANLLLARAGTRRRELAVRTALGASRGRLLRQFIVEGIVLSLLGAVLGLGLAWAGVRTLTVAYPDGLPRVAEVHADPVVLGFTMFLSVLTGVAFGLVPLLQVSAAGFERLLKDAGTRGATTARRVRGALVAGEVALAVVLVVAAGLMVRTVLNLMNVDAGFERSRLVTFGVALPAATYSTFDRRVQVYRAFDRSSRRHAGCGRRLDRVRAPATPSGQRLRDRYRRLYAAPGRVGRGGLLPDGHRRLFRHDAHTDRAGPRIPEGRPRRRACGAGQRDVCAHLLERPRSDRPARETTLW